MTPEERLDAVRELCENACLRPAAKRLRLATVEQSLAEQAPKPAPVPYEELHPPRVIVGGFTSSGYKQRQPKAGHCAICGKRPEYCTCRAQRKECETQRPDPNWMTKAVEKTNEAA